MINRELIVAEGFLHKTPLGGKHIKCSSQLTKHITYAYDGCRLDHLKITLNIKSKVDAEYLIADLEELKIMLEIHKNCFI